MPLHICMYTHPFDSTTSSRLYFFTISWGMMFSCIFVFGLGEFVVKVTSNIGHDIFCVFGQYDTVEETF